MSWTGWGATNTGGTIYITYAQQQQRAVPACNVCGKAADRQTMPDKRLWCNRCLLARSREYFETLFGAVAPDQRARLYRALASVFHPDVGGDERIMRLLNDLKEQI